MSDKVIIVTPPDDIHVDGLRILLVDLTLDQTQLISEALAQIQEMPTIVTYVWQTGNDIEWLLDKKHKSYYLTIFNADSQNDIVVGYLAAQNNSYYFGTLKNLSKANTRVINNSHELLDVLLLTIAKYE
jgi:hypothetical protein